MDTDTDNKNGPHILVIDDNLNEVKTLIIGLGLEGFQVEGAGDGQKALEMLAKKKYDMALIDLMMPEINGIQLARKIRQDYPDVTTVLMSAFNLSPVQIAKADLGVVGFVTKPFRFEKLVEMIKSKLENRNGGKIEFVSSPSYAF